MLNYKFIYYLVLVVFFFTQPLPVSYAQEEEKPTVTTANVVEAAKAVANDAGLNIKDNVINVNQNVDVWRVTFTPRAIWRAKNPITVTLKQTKQNALVPVDIK
ncbi:MAG: hypothetical protein V2A72_00030 [Candidatus Omnitrophota bacterium]